MIEGSSRDKRTLLAEKAPRTKVGMGPPNKVEGNDGDLQVRQLKNKVKLFVKYKGTWHGVNVGKSFDVVEKQSEDAIKSKDNFTNRNQVATNKIISDSDFTLDSSGDIELNADGGQVNIMDGADIAFVFDCDVPRFRIYDDANSADHFSISVGAEGATTLVTVDVGSALAHLTLTPDGDLILDPASQKVIINATDGLYLDGGGDTYIYEVAADIARVIVGGDQLLELTESGDDGNSVNFKNSCAGFTQLEPTYNASITTVDFRFSNKQNLTFGAGNITNLSMYFPTMSGNFQLLIKQDGTGSRTVTNYRVYEFDESLADGEAAVKFAGGSNPTLTTDANHVDILSFYWDADNEICYGTSTLDFQF